jgi:LysM repeat protein
MDAAPRRVKHRAVRAFPAALASLLLVCWVGLASAASSPRYHTVASGQRLGSIAKRYGVTVDAICTANAIERNGRLKVGQKLLVPARSDKDGTLTRRQYGPPERKTAQSAPSTLLASTREASTPATHRVYAGQRLESIARRYRVSIEALCDANRIRRTDKLKPGQVLVIPGSLPEGGMANLTTNADFRPTTSNGKKRGYVDLSTYTSRYRGVVFDKKGRVAASAVESISRLFGATGKRPRVDPRLIALLADVSEHFGGRPVRVVSGWRDHSYFEDSRHKHSQAVDFSIPGVPNTVLRDYVRRFRNCGVGFYPNSSFVHLDVRESAAYWVDYAGPGEAPRNKPGAPPRSAVARAEPPAGPIEEAQTDVVDRASGSALPMAKPTEYPAEAMPGADVTSGASVTRPVVRSAPEAAATPGPAPTPSPVARPTPAPTTTTPPL